MKRDMRKAEDEEKWMEKANDREHWKKQRKYPCSKVTNNQPNPTQGKQEEEQEVANSPPGGETGRPAGFFPPTR